MRRWMLLAGAAAAVAVSGTVLWPREQGPVLEPERAALLRETGATIPRNRPSGKVHEVELVAAPTTAQLLEGRALDVWAYNGQVPGPTIRARAGDKLRVRLRNELPQPTTIHWHGLRLPNGMDGVPGVTQPPIESGASFTYEFVLPDAGTFWFHPHVRGSEQVERGLHGVLIVEPRDDEPRERELVWLLDDWRLAEDGQIDPEFVTRHDLAHDGRWGQISTVNGRVRPTVDVRAGEAVLVRLINAANGRIFAPDLSAFDANVVAFDGVPTSRPLPATKLELAPGNRADVLLRVPADANGTIDVVDRFTRRPFVLATLRVDGKVENAPLAPREFREVPAWTSASALEPDHVFELNAARGGRAGIEWQINGKAMVHDDGHAKHDPPTKLQLGRPTKLRFVNASARLHPMHLHGQFFKVIARNGQPVDEGHWRDTVLLRGRDSVDVVVVPEDEGTWALHCHILEHHDSGMMTLVKVERAR